MKINLRKENYIPFVLFLILFLNYIPLFIANYGVNVSGVSVGIKEMTICFAIEIITMLIFVFKRIKFNKEFFVHLALLFATSVIMFGIQIKNFISGTYELMDFANIICIGINILILFIALLNIRVDEKCIYSFFKGMICLGIFVCVVSIALYHERILTLFGIGGQVKFTSISGIFAHRNQFAIFLYITIIANIFLFIKENKVRYIITLLFFGANLLFTASRTGILCTAVFIFLIFLITGKIKAKNKVIICTIGAILGIISVYIVYNNFPNIVESVSKVFVRKNTIKNFTGRSTIWNVGFNLIMQTPITFLFGVGRFIGILALDTTRFADVTQFHSFYIDMLVTGGIMELLYLLFIYFTVVRKILKSGIDKEYKKIYICAYISYAIYCLCESLGRFSIGCADTVCLISFVSIPLLHANSKPKIKEIEEGKVT